MDLKDIFPLVVIVLAFLFKALASQKTKSKNPVPVKKHVPSKKEKEQKPLAPKVAFAKSAAPLAKKIPPAKPARQSQGKVRFFRSKDELKKGFIMQEILRRHTDSF